MSISLRALVRPLLLGAAVSLAALSGAQSATDHPNLKGGNDRTGSVANPGAASPGFLRNESVAAGVAVPSSLRWFTPLVSGTAPTSLRTNEVSAVQTIIDNTDDGNLNQFDSQGNNVGPFDPNLSGVAGASAGWSAPNELQEAILPYTQVRRRNIVTIGANTYARDPNPRFPAYLYTQTVASAPGRDPRVPLVAGLLRTFSWSFTPRLNTQTAPPFTAPIVDPTPKSYALYVWVPEGQTLVGANYVPRQRYFVYEITYGTGQKYVDVVDTNASGVGWVRLGNGGRPTTQVFPYAGVNPGTGAPYPITITLFNTIPRDTNGNLTEDVTNPNILQDRLVYADATRFSTLTSSILATPTNAGFGSADIRVMDVTNTPVVLPSNNTDYLVPPNAITRGTVTSRVWNYGTPVWSYSPDATTLNAITFDNDNPVFINGGFATGTAAPHQGADYFESGVVTGANPDPTLVATANITVDPNTALPEDAYELEMYVPGTNGSLTVTNSLTYQIFEGGVSAGVFTLNETGNPGYRRLGNRRYSHSAANRLTIVFYNSSTDPTQAGTRAVVDQVRFVGGQGTAVTSTPVHASALIRQTPTGAPVATNVVIVADERGRLHCIDAVGNGDGTTRVYWTYPSTPNVRGTDTDGTPIYKDPNLAGDGDPGRDANDPAGKIWDGDNNELSAVMPTSFDLSTAIVTRQTVTVAPTVTEQRDFLVIAATNGRVYCIAMEGRGDGTATAPGTTFRRWTFPETFPGQDAGSNLGEITSVSLGTFDVAGVPTYRVFAATESGRIYALDPLGGTADQYNDADLSPAQAWQYPANNVQPLNSIVGAPAVDNVGQRLFVGTTVSDVGGSQLLCLDGTTGAVNWTYTGAVGESLPLSWRSGPAYVPVTELNNAGVQPNQTVGVALADSVFAMNENGYVYSFNANNGQILWRTNELQSGGRGSLSYARIQAYDRNGIVSALPFPMVLVPTESGRFAALFARAGDETAFAIADPGYQPGRGNRQAWGARTDSAITASMTNGNQWLYGASEEGYLFAWSDNANVGGGGFGGFIPPIIEDITDNNNDPAVAEFRNAEVAILSRQGFVALRQTQPGTITSTLNKAQVINDGATYTQPQGRVIAPYATTKSAPLTFEWGETIYLIVYNFPARTTNPAGEDVTPPTIEVTVNTEGKSSRPVVSEARIFRDKNESDPDGGYAILQIPLTSGGSTSLPPGPGAVSVQIRTSALNNSQIPQAISLLPARSRLSYVVANPLAIWMGQGNAAGPYSIGYSPIANLPENRVNGSPAIATNGGATNASLLALKYGNASHGQTQVTNMVVYDRSLMTLLRGAGRGLDNVRVDRRDMEWQGGAATVYKPLTFLDPTLFAKFEDLPVNYPNNSLDYPDIRRERVTVIKDPDGNAENPLFSGVQLRGPRNLNANLTPDTPQAQLDTRTLIPTVFQYKVDVPRYQPGPLMTAAALIADSTGSTAFAQGYAGRNSVFVDSNGNGKVEQSSEAFRSFNSFVSVLSDENLKVLTQTVDLGSLPAGAGYDSRLTYTNAPPYRNMGPATVFSPWGGAYEQMFKPFTVINDGNVNLLNVRLAKGTTPQSTGTGLFPWQVYSLANDDYSAWLTGSLDIWSDIDATFAPQWAAGRNEVIGQKPRVTDVAGRAIQANPISRFNPNIPNSGTPLLGGFESRDPRITATVPMGFPVGSYSQVMRIFEKRPDSAGPSEVMSLNYRNDGRIDPRDSYSDPGLNLNLTVTETQLTGGTSAYSTPGIDPGTAIDANFTSGYASRQPAAIRSINGDMTLVFASNRPVWEPLAGTNPGANDPYRLWFTSLDGNAPGATTGLTPDPTTRDLNQFKPATTARWWGQQVGGYPVGTANQIFGLTDAVDAQTNFGFPALPSTGFADPFTYGDPAGTNYNSTFLTFVGNTIRQQAAGGAALLDSRIFAVPFSSGTGPAGQPVALNYDTESKKGKPAIFASTSSEGYGATIAYSATSNGISSLYFTRFDGTQFSKPLALNLSNAFESVSEPSMQLRAITDPSTGNPVQVIQLGFTGRLRGRPGTEVFLTNIIAGADHLPAKPLRFVQFQVFGERMAFDARTATYRVRGVYLREPVIDTATGLIRVDAGGNPEERVNLASTPNVDIRVKAGTYAGTIDRDSRIESAPSDQLGGQVYTDRNAGTVRVVGSALPRTSQLLMTYQSSILRVSTNDNAGYSNPSVLYDTRITTGNSMTNVADAYWYGNTDAPLPPNSPLSFADRTMLIFNRSAQPGGQVARPYVMSYRNGIRVGREIATDANGNLAETVRVRTATNGAINGAYQVAPALGRIYLTHLDEGSGIRVELGGIAGNPNYPPITIIQGAGIVGERAEEAITLGRATNESNFSVFLDPVFPENPRRGLLWMFWTSTRNGTPNLFYQTIAPNMVPTTPKQ